MILAIDIGNTNISFGLFKSKRIIKTFDIPTRSFTGRSLKKHLAALKPEVCLIASVVPATTKKVYAQVKQITGNKTYIIGKDIEVPIKNLYHHPKQAGLDRLVNAYAGLKLYGKPLIIIDFGTGVTFDLLSNKGEYLGGLILPGIRLALKALWENTALLPKIKLRMPKSLIGRDTASGMLSGVIYGYAGLSENLINRLRNSVGRSAKVIATGGDSKLISRICKTIDAVDPHLTLKGIRLCYQE